MRILKQRALLYLSTNFQLKRELGQMHGLNVAPQAAPGDCSSCLDRFSCVTSCKTMRCMHDATLRNTNLRQLSRNSIGWGRAGGAVHTVTKYLCICNMIHTNIQISDMRIHICIYIYVHTFIYICISLLRCTYEIRHPTNKLSYHDSETKLFTIYIHTLVT